MANGATLKASRCPESELWGYVDQRGRQVVEPRFVAREGFDCGFAIVTVGVPWELLRQAG
jgi:hypothetical protein